MLMFKSIKKIFSGKKLWIVVLLILPLSVSAIDWKNPLEYDSIEELIKALAGFLAKVAWALIPLMILIGAFYILTAMGNPERITTGKKIILWTVVGTVVLLLAWGLPDLIKNILNQGSAV